MALLKKYSTGTADLQKQTLNKDIAKTQKLTSGLETGSPIEAAGGDPISSIATGVMAGLGNLGTSQPTSTDNKALDEANKVGKGIETGYTVVGAGIGAFFGMPQLGAAAGKVMGSTYGDTYKSVVAGKINKGYTDALRKEVQANTNQMRANPLASGKMTYQKTEDVTKIKPLDVLTGTWGAKLALRGINKKRVQSEDAKQKALVDTYNTDLAKAQKAANNRNKDLQAQAATNLMSAKRGGLLTYAASGVIKVDAPKENTVPAKKCGGTMKKGGKTPICECGCRAGKRIYRRGGELDVAKQNVILDGPSHEHVNNTGVTEDKGLPIVKNGKKIAEIESLELVINAEASRKIEALRDRVRKGDTAAETELAKLLEHELTNNTYDYSGALIS